LAAAHTVHFCLCRLCLTSLGRALPPAVSSKHIHSN
jgi:hypothetical protein